MGQGHALSVLARAYHHSGGDTLYLNSALAGLRPFNVASSDGGVLANFLGRIPWYEEYPTQPASFVLILIRMNTARIQRSILILSCHPFPGLSLTSPHKPLMHFYSPPRTLFSTKIYRPEIF